MKYIATIILISLAISFITVLNADAQQLVYEPKNPAFGGNPGNYSWLMNSANSQNRFDEAASSASRFQRDPLSDFQSSLQRQVLSQLTRDIVNRQFGEGEIEERSFEFGEFSIDVVPGLDDVQIVIRNILTGDETSISVPSL